MAVLGEAAALVLPLRERWELVFAWRFGVATFRTDMLTGVPGAALRGTLRGDEPLVAVPAAAPATRRM